MEYQASSQTDGNESISIVFLASIRKHTKHETRKHTKSSFLQVGHSRIEVLGKKAVHDHILTDPTRRRKIAAVPHYWRTRIIRQQLHSPKYHTRFAPVRVCQQRTGYPQFATARVLESFVSVVPANLSKGSRCHHTAFIVLTKIAEENNYELVNLMYWFLHLEG